jgi:small subunit ribosomal protein S15
MFRAIARSSSSTHQQPNVSHISNLSVTGNAIIPFITRAPSCSFHMSAPTLESSKKQHARLIKKKNLARRAELAEEAKRTRPHVVLGYASGQEWLWKRSDLAKILVSDAERKPLPPIKAWDQQRLNHEFSTKQAYPHGPTPPPSSLNYGVDSVSAELLFEHLPRVATQRPLLQLDPLAAPEIHSQAYEEALTEQLAASDQMHRMLHLSNASAGGIAFENRRRIIDAFSPEKPTDTGQSEVQGERVAESVV